MGLLDRLFRPKPVATQLSAPTTSSANAPQVNDFGGSRTTLPKFVQGGGGVFGALPKRTQRELGLDERRFGAYSLDDLLDILTDAHPDISFALWNFLRLSNSGYTIKVHKLGSKKPWSQASKLIDELIDKLNLPNMHRFELSRSFDKVVNQLLLSTVTRGAAAVELVLAPQYNDVAFLAPIDPATVDFKFEQDRFVPYQDEEKMSLDVPTFIYEALDPRIDDPYGRSPLISAITMIMFQLQILNDIKAVVHNQGYPRFDIKIVEEILLKRMPVSVRNNEAEKQKWLNNQLQTIINMYNQLEPDDTFVHYDSIEIGTVGGGKGGGAVIDPEKLMGVVDNLVMAGLKTLSTILGRRSTGNTESFAKLEIKLYLKGVAAVQRTVEAAMSRALTLYLNIKGKQGIVTFTFNPVEVRTELERAQFEQVALLNYAFMRDQGWIDQDEASMRAVGKPAVGEPTGGTPTNSDGAPIQGRVDERNENPPPEAAGTE